MSLPVRTTPEADAQIREIDAWWRTNRRSSPDLFLEELAASFEVVGNAPQIGRLYRQSPVPGTRRVLLKATRYHVYYVPRFILLFERLAIEWLKAASQAAVAARLQLSWDEIHGILDRAVRRGLARRAADPVPYVGVDEKAFRKGHRYLTLVNDLTRSRVLYVAAERKQTSLDGFWPTLTAAQRDAIQGIAVDMWDPYLASIRAHLPNADTKIVFDKFHIAQHLGEAVDRVRRAENKALRAEGDDRLVGTKYDWLRHPGAFARDAWRSFQDLRTSALQTARAWALKETAMALFHYRDVGSARKYFARWYAWASRCRLVPMVNVAQMLKRRLENILTYLTHPITNAASESLNAKVQWVKYTARGFRNEQNFINAIYFHCGGLDLAP